MWFVYLIMVSSVRSNYIIQLRHGHGGLGGACIVTDFVQYEDTYSGPSVLNKLLHTSKSVFL